MGGICYCFKVIFEKLAKMSLEILHYLKFSNFGIAAQLNVEMKEF